MYVLQRTKSPECRPWILLDQVSVWDVLPFTNHSHGHFHLIEKKKKWKESFLLSHMAVVITERAQVGENALKLQGHTHIGYS